MADEPANSGGEGLRDTTLDYHGPAGKICSRGVIAFVLGAAGLLTAMIFIGGLLGVGAILFGFIAVFEIDRDPERKGGKGYALWGILMGILAVLLAAVMVPSIGRPIEAANRGTCSANLRGIVQSMAVYSASNGDRFPVVSNAPYGASNGGASAEKGGSDANAAIATMQAPGSPVAGSPIAGAWMLVLDGSVSSKQFICKSDPASSLPASSADAAGNYYLMFQKDDQFSYSFAYPWASNGKVGDWWKETEDASLPIGSDMAPAPGTGKPKRDLAVVAKGNTGNHNGEGQNVAFGDNHVEFLRDTRTGQDGDNIFTVSGDLTRGSPTGVAPKLAPIHVGGTPGNHDTVMVPERDLDTGKLW